MRSPLLAFGAPPDLVAWTALGLAVAALAFALRPPARALAFAEQHPRAMVGVLAALAAALSFGYVDHYLRGGPRIIDATSYFLEAQSFARGRFGFDVPDPSGAFRGRFLITPSGGDALHVIFPPGYPAFLALGFLIGAPLALGPLTAAALVVVSYGLGLKLFGTTRAGLGAALFSVLSAALRYHTADTMTHGLGALLFALTLYTALSGGRLLIVSGLALGWLTATRPLTGLAALVVVLLAVRPWSAKRALAVAAGSLPGLALLVLHQRAATGSWLESSQLRYYALADGPPGCFRLGFGSGIGCVFEHGDVVAQRLANGFGPIEALGATVRRLHHHLLDVANFEPLALLVVVAAVFCFRDRRQRLLVIGPLALVAAYLPFYFDATYPGGGARLYAEALPLEHVLLGGWLARIGHARWAPPLALAGFALHGCFSHLALREREGGRPMFEPEVLARAGVSRGLVFVSTDHGFNLGHRPGNRELVVAREHGDGHDRLLWERLGRPPAYRYVFDPWTRSTSPAVFPYEPEPSLRFEGEAQWPLVAIYEGYSLPGYPSSGCTSGGRALRLVPVGGGVRAEIEVTAPAEGSWEVVMGWGSFDGPASVEVALGDVVGRVKLPRECSESAIRAPLTTARQRLSISVRDAPAWLDYVELRNREPDRESAP